MTEPHRALGVAEARIAQLTAELLRLPLASAVALVSCAPRESLLATGAQYALASALLTTVGARASANSTDLLRVLAETQSDEWFTAADLHKAVESDENDPLCGVLASFAGDSRELGTHLTALARSGTQSQGLTIECDARPKKSNRYRVRRAGDPPHLLPD